MRFDHVSNWFQLIASVAVVAGLALVVGELRQAKQLAGAELLATNYMGFAERELAVLGENPAPVLVRSCLDPESVTDEDARVLVSHYQQLLFALAGMIEVELVGDFGTERWRTFASGTLLNVLTTEHGRWYWEWVKPTLYPGLRELGDALVEDLGAASCASFWESFRQLAPVRADMLLPGPSN